MPEVTTDAGGGAGSSGDLAGGAERSGGTKLTPRTRGSSAGRAASAEPIDH